MALFGGSAPCPHCGEKVREHWNQEQFLCPHCGQPGPFATAEQVAQWDATQSARADFERALGLVAAGAPVDMRGEQLATTALATGYTSGQLVSMKAGAVGELVSHLLADDLVSADEYGQINAATSLLGISLAQVYALDSDLESRLLIALANGGALQPLPSPTLLARKGELVYLEWPARLLKTVEKREFQAGYSGFSFPIGKTGIRYRIGGARGHSVVVGSEVKVADTGTLSVSSRRAVFMGDSKTIEMPYSKLVNLTVYSDGIRFHLSNRVNAPTFLLDMAMGSRGEVVAAIVHNAIQQA